MYDLSPVHSLKPGFVNTRPHSTKVSKTRSTEWLVFYLTDAYKIGICF